MFLCFPFCLTAGSKETTEFDIKVASKLVDAVLVVLDNVYHMPGSGDLTEVMQQAVHAVMVRGHVCLCACMCMCVCERECVCVRLCDGVCVYARACVCETSGWLCMCAWW